MFFITGLVCKTHFHPIFLFQDGRQLVGRFMAFDRHMNLVLGDAEEFRKLPPKKGSGDAERESRRPLGFLLVRGEEIISLTVEGPPPNEHRGKKDGGPVRRPPCKRGLIVNPTLVLRLGEYVHLSERDSIAFEQVVLTVWRCQRASLHFWRISLQLLLVLEGFPVAQELERLSQEAETRPACPISAGWPGRWKARWPWNPCRDAGPGAGRPCGPCARTGWPGRRVDETTGEAMRVRQLAKH